MNSGSGWMNDSTPVPETTTAKMICPLVFPAQSVKVTKRMPAPIETASALEPSSRAIFARESFALPDREHAAVTGLATPDPNVTETLVHAVPHKKFLVDWIPIALEYEARMVTASVGENLSEADPLCVKLRTKGKIPVTSGAVTRKVAADESSGIETVLLLNKASLVAEIRTTRLCRNGTGAERVYVKIALDPEFV